MTEERAPKPGSWSAQADCAGWGWRGVPSSSTPLTFPGLVFRLVEVRPGTE